MSRMTGRAALAVRLRVQLCPKDMQGCIGVRPIRTNVLGYAPSGENGIDDRTTPTGSAQLGRLDDGVWTHAEGLTAHKNCIRLSSKQRHPAPVFIRCHVKVMVPYRPNPAIKADCGVGEYPHDFT
jgi:hypothetical protein